MSVMPVGQVLGFADPRVCLWQGDRHWGGMLVGLSPTQKCAAVGCVLTSVAMAARILDLHQGATPPWVQGRGLAHTERVWSPSSAAAVIPRLAKACGIACAEHPVRGSTPFLVNTILGALRDGGVALVHVDTDSADDDEVGKHWGCVYRAQVRQGYTDEGVLHFADPATAGARRAAGAAVPGIEGLDLHTLTGCVMWGARPRPYAVRAVRPLYRLA